MGLYSALYWALTSNSPVGRRQEIISILWNLVSNKAPRKLSLMHILCRYASYIRLNLSEKQYRPVQ